jgi:hypothetical protein
MKDKLIVGLLAVALLVGLTALGLQLKPKSLGTSFTINPSTNSYADSGADWRQNLQAVSERMAGLSQYQILQANSAGQMEAVAPSALADTTWDFDGARIASLVKQGVIASFAATATSTAANVCDNTQWRVIASEAAPTIELPPTSTLFADCLTTAGDSVSFLINNGSLVTSTLITAGTGGTLLVSSSTTIPATDSASVIVERLDDVAYRALLTNFAD